MLSDRDIKRELGRNILLYPINKNNIKEASINLTASSMAWSAKTKERLLADGEIVIPVHETALILTHEVLSVSRKIAGTYHSRVTTASMGLGHIGTTLNPGWIGRSLIALHNTSDQLIKIKVNDPIVTVCFYYLNSKSAVNDKSLPGRPEILNGIIFTEEEKEQYYAEYNSKKSVLKEIMLGCEEFKEIKKKNPKEIFLWSGLTAILVMLITLVALFINTDPWKTILCSVLAAYLPFYLLIISKKIK